MTHSYALITGASSGIGYATVALFRAAGWKVIATVRTTSDVMRLTADFGPDVSPIIADVTDEKSLKAAADKVCALVSSGSLDAIICNAGVAYAAPLMCLPLDRLDALYQINVRGVLATLQSFFPLMQLDKVKRRGQKNIRIILLSSVSGRFSYPFLGAYAASKYALEAIGDSLRREMRPYPVDVVLIEPGPIQTPLWGKVAKASDISQCSDTAWKKPLERFRDFAQQCETQGLSSESVARLILKTTMARKPKARYVIGASLLSGFAIRFLPTSWIDWGVCAALGLKKK